MTPTFAALMQFLHVFAAVAWIGGLVFALAVLLPATPTIALRDRPRFMPLIFKRFLHIVWGSAGLLLITGLWRVLAHWPGMTAAFWSSRIGILVGLKLVVFAAILAVAGSVTWRVRPRIMAHLPSHAGDPPDAYQCPQCGSLVGGLRRHFQVGLLLGLVLLLLGVWLSGA